VLLFVFSSGQIIGHRDERTFARDSGKSLGIMKEDDLQGREKVIIPVQKAAQLSAKNRYAHLKGSVKRG